MVLSFIVPIQAPILLVGLGVTSQHADRAVGGLGFARDPGRFAGLAIAASTLRYRRLQRAVAGSAGVGAVAADARAKLIAVLVAVLIHGLGAGLLVPNVMAPVMNALSARTRGRGLGGSRLACISANLSARWWWRCSVSTPLTCAPPSSGWRWPALPRRRSGRWQACTPDVKGLRVPSGQVIRN